MATYYDELGVLPTATAAEIKRRYRKLALTAHPDAPTGSDAAFVRLSTAYDTLSNALTRREYDAKLATKKAPVASAPSPPASSYSTAGTTRSTPRATAAPAQANGFWGSFFGKLTMVFIFLIVVLAIRAGFLWVQNTGATNIVAPKTVAPTVTSPGIQNVTPTTPTTPTTDSTTDTSTDSTGNSSNNPDSTNDSSPNASSNTSSGTSSSSSSSSSMTIPTTGQVQPPGTTPQTTTP